MIVWLDIDGVLTHWNAGIHERLGIEHSYEDWPYALGREGWHWHNEVGKSFEDINKLCDFDLWANLPWIPGGKEIYASVVGRFGYSSIRLLTTPMPHVQSASGKVEWVNRNVPMLQKQLIVTTAPKETFAGVPDSVLIDDSSANIDAWRAAGGRAILVPRYWNDDYKYADVSAAVVDERLRLAMERRNRDE